MNTPWISCDINPFWFSPGADVPEYLPCTAVTRLHWHKALDGRDLIGLEAQLPVGKRVLELEDGGMLELVIIKAGERDNYKNKDTVIFRASLCVSQSREVFDPIVNSPENRIVLATVELSCRLEVLPDD